MSLLKPQSTLIFLCDVQTKFRPSIHGYDDIITSINKLVKIAKLVQCEVLATTQNAKALGPTDPAIDLASLGDLFIGTFDKTLFSMLTPAVESLLLSKRPASIIITGIETHICVLQTTLQLLAHPQKYKVYVVYDAVASSHPTELRIAVERMRAAGAVIATSESLGFELVGDASHPNFREFSRVIKESKLGKTRDVEGKM